MFFVRRFVTIEYQAGNGRMPLDVSQMFGGRAGTQFVLMVVSRSVEASVSHPLVGGLMAQNVA